MYECSPRQARARCSDSEAARLMSSCSFLREGGETRARFDRHKDAPTRRYEAPRALSVSRRRHAFLKLLMRSNAAAYLRLSRHIMRSVVALSAPEAFGAWKTALIPLPIRSQRVAPGKIEVNVIAVIRELIEHSSPPNMRRRKSSPARFVRMSGTVAPASPRASTVTNALGCRDTTQHQNVASLTRTDCR